ncbi:MAG: dihydrofolate reductase [Chitinophagaceae bacterium]|jgi:dihydrofolate reductase|nr:dihydrofolate reductase [Chitinophagaceae bacterium]
MIISIIVAASENNVIGKDNRLPWHLPADLKYFKNTTWALPIIMGRRTFESIGKPLPGRHNIIITRNREYKADSVTVVSSVEDAIKAAEAGAVNELFIIGGAELFNTTLEMANKVYLTRVHTIIDGDVFFPSLREDQWKQITEKNTDADEKNEYPLSFQIWERRNYKSHNSY